MDNVELAEERLTLQRAGARLELVYVEERQELTICARVGGPQGNVLLVEGGEVERAQFQLTGPAARIFWGSLVGQSAPIPAQVERVPTEAQADDKQSTHRAERAPKPRRTRASRGVVLQPRDLSMLAALGEARMLTAQAIEWLFYPGWRERYERLCEAGQAGEHRPSGNVYARLGALTRLDPPLLFRLTRLSEHIDEGVGRLDGAYLLTEDGAERVASSTGVEMDTLCYQGRRKRPIKNLEHSVAVSTFYAALRSALEHDGLLLEDWRGDHQLAGRDPQGGGLNYDRVPTPGGTELLPVLPDATFTIDGRRFFAEIDLGTINVERWRERIRGFEVYRGSAELEARYGVADFTVLIVCPNANRQRRIAEELLKVVREPSDRYLFATDDQVHPTTIRSAWQRVTGCTWGQRQVIDRLVETPTDLRWSTTIILAEGAQPRPKPPVVSRWTEDEEGLDL